MRVIMLTEVTHMTTIFQYISTMLPFMVMAIPIYLIGRFFYLKGKHNIIKLNLRHEIGLLIFTSFIFGLASLTILPAFKIDNNGIEFITNGNGSINFIPFKAFSVTYNMLFQEHNINYFLINIIGNIVMFIPFGFFPALLWNRYTFQKAIFIGFFSSLFIEICQLRLPRETDIDDIWLNVIGAILGFLLFKLIEKFYSAKIIKFRCYKQN